MPDKATFTMTTCPHCGGSTPMVADFCANCGSPNAMGKSATAAAESALAKHILANAHATDLATGTIHPNPHASSVTSSPAKARVFADVIPQDVRRAMESAGVTLTADPETGSTRFSLNGFVLARIEVDPPAVVWDDANLGRFLRELFAYHEWALGLDEARGSDREWLLSQPKRFPDVSTAEAAGVSVRLTGNGFMGRTAHFAHRALGEFARHQAGHSVAFSSPEVFIPLGMLVELDRLFTPVPYGYGSDPICLSPYAMSVYDARNQELRRAAQGNGFEFGTFAVFKADDRGGKEVKVRVDLTDDPSEGGSDARYAAYRLVLAAFGFDRDILRVLIDFDDDYGVRGGRVVADTAELTRDLADDDAALDSFAKDHVRGLHGDLLHLCDAWEREIKYVDSRFRQLIKKEGGMGAARRVLANPSVSTAFTRLAASGNLELTVEYVVLRPEWGPLFTQEEREVAWSRLVHAGMSEEQLPGFYSYQ